MYLVFAIFSIEMYNYHFDHILLYFWGDVLNSLMCLVFLIAVLCSTFADKKNIDYVCLKLLDCKISIVFNCMLGRLYLLTFFFLSVFLSFFFLPGIILLFIKSFHVYT